MNDSCQKYGPQMKDLCQTFLSLYSCFVNKLSLGSLMKNYKSNLRDLDLDLEFKSRAFYRRFCRLLISKINKLLLSVTKINNNSIG